MKYGLMPNDRQELTKKDQIWICRSHFEGEWKSVRGGKRPVNPPSVFHGIPKSCFKQEVSKPRTTKVTSSEQRQKKEQGIKEKKDKINNFENFVKCIAKHVDKKFKFTRHGKELTMYMTDTLGKQVIKFLHFREVNSLFGFLHLVSAEKKMDLMPDGKY